MSKKSKSDSGTKQFWFKAKKYGYGWSLPLTRAGWVSSLGLLGLGLSPILYLSIWYKGDEYCQNILSKGISAACDPHAETGAYVMAALFWLIACVLLLAHICSLKGQPAKWRWPRKENHAKKS